MPDKSKLKETHLKETWIEKDFEMFFSEKIRSTELPNLERMNCKFNILVHFLDKRISLKCFTNHLLF